MTRLRTDITPMTDAQHMVRLMAWLSPSFPTGAFAFSHGLESAAAKGVITSKEDLQSWLEALLIHGTVWNDAVLAAEAWRRSDAPPQLQELEELAVALCGSLERQMETTAQGTAFIAAARHWPGGVDGLPAGDVALPVAFGAVAGRMGVPLEPALSCFAHAALSNLVQAAIRLSVLGQAGGVAVTVALEEAVLDTAHRASRATLDDLGSATLVSDIMAMRHEILEPRIFRS